jgi:hypothetical protein
MAILIVCLTLVGLIGTAYADQPRDIGTFSNRTVAAGDGWLTSTSRYRSNVVIDNYAMCMTSAYTGTLRWVTEYKESATKRYYATPQTNNYVVYGWTYQLYLDKYLTWYGPNYAYLLYLYNTSNSSSTVTGEWGP